MKIYLIIKWVLIAFLSLQRIGNGRLASYVKKSEELVLIPLRKID